MSTDIFYYNEHTVGQASVLMSSDIFYYNEHTVGRASVLMSSDILYYDEHSVGQALDQKATKTRKYTAILFSVS